MGPEQKLNHHCWSWINRICSIRFNIQHHSTLFHTLRFCSSPVRPMEVSLIQIFPRPDLRVPMPQVADTVSSRVSVAKRAMRFHDDPSWPIVTIYLFQTLISISIITADNWNQSTKLLHKLHCHRQHVLFQAAPLSRRPQGEILQECLTNRRNLQRQIGGKSETEVTDIHWP